MKWLPSSGRMRGDLAPVGHELTALSSAMTAWRDVQHDEDGAHTGITADSIETTGLNALGGPTQIPDGAVLEPPTIVVSQNNYNPPGLADVRVVRLTTDASHAITGILTDPRYNRDLRLINAGNFDFTIPHNSASSFALYRIACPLGTTLTVGSGAVVDLYYDIHAGNWRVVGGAGSITGLSTAASVGAAPDSADYLVKTANGSLSAERVVTDNTDITADWSVGGGVKFLLGAFTGDITKTAGSLATTIANLAVTTATIALNAVTNARLAQMAQATFKGRAAASGTGDPVDLTANQASTILDTATDPFLRTSASGATGSAWSVLTNGDGGSPELVWDSNGDVIMTETYR